MSVESLTVNDRRNNGEVVTVFTDNRAHPNPEPMLFMDSKAHPNPRLMLFMDSRAIFFIYFLISHYQSTAGGDLSMLFPLHAGFEPTLPR